MRWKWWLTPRNPRFVYMLAGSCFTGGVQCVVTGVLQGIQWAWFMVPLGAAAIFMGFISVHYQRRREDYEGSAWAKYQNKEFDRMCDTAMRTIASRINDDLEKAGHGRPVHVQEVSVH